MDITKLITTVGLAMTVLTTITSSQLLTYASPTTEDDGWVEGDYEGNKAEQEEQAQEDWEDAGRPGDDNDDDSSNDNDNDSEESQQIFTCSDGSTVTGDEECPPIGPNPYCDTERGKAAPVCHDRLDYDQETGLYPCNDGTQKVDWRDCKDASGFSNNRDTSSSNIPECQNGVIQECVITEIGLICKPGYDLSNPNIVGGGHACQDIYAGTYEPESDNNFNPNNDNYDNSNSDNMPECKRDVLQECKLRGNTGLLCGVEDLMQGDYNPNVIGDGHACHDVYVGTYNQLEYCNDGTYVVSCGSIGVYPGIP
jgi:hypothetical protein